MNGKAKTEFLYIDDDKLPTESGGYLMPRFGSNISSSTTNSTASNVALIKKKAPYEFTPPKPNNNTNNKKAYSPSPPPIKSNKLTSFKTNDYDSTDV